MSDSNASSTASIIRIAQYGEWQEFYEYMSSISLNFGKCGDLLFNEDVLPTFEIEDRPVRIEDESEDGFSFRNKIWFHDKKRKEEAGDRYEREATKLVDHLCRSFHERSMLNIRKNPGEFNTAKAQRNFRTIFSILKRECKRVAVHHTAAHNNSIISDTKQSQCASFNAYIAKIQRAKKELEEEPGERMSDSLLKKYFIVNIDQSMFASQITKFRDVGGMMTFDELVASCDLKYMNLDYDLENIVSKEVSKGQISGTTKAYYDVVDVTSPVYGRNKSNIDCNNKARSKDTRELEKRYPAKIGEVCKDDRCSMIGSVHKKAYHLIMDNHKALRMKKSSAENKLCHICRKHGHIAKDCRQKPENKEQQSKSSPSGGFNNRQHGRKVSFNASRVQCEVDYEDDEYYSDESNGIFTSAYHARVEVVYSDEESNEPEECQCAVLCELTASPVDKAAFLPENHARSEVTNDKEEGLPESDFETFNISQLHRRRSAALLEGLMGESPIRHLLHDSDQQQRSSEARRIVQDDADFEKSWARPDEVSVEEEATHVYARMVKTENLSADAIVFTPKDFPPDRKDIKVIIDNGCVNSSAVYDVRLLSKTFKSKGRVNNAHGATGKLVRFGHVSFAGTTLVDPDLVSNLINSSSIHLRLGTVGIENGDAYQFVRTTDGLILLSATFIPNIGYVSDLRSLEHAERLLALPSYPTQRDYVKYRIDENDDDNPRYHSYLVRRERVPLSNNNVIANRLLTPTFSPHQKTRANSALQASKGLGFPSEENLVIMADTGEFTNMDFTGNDVRNAYKIHGPCPSHLSGTANAIPAKASTSEPAKTIGDNICIDLKRFSKPTIGGGNEALISCDEHTSYLVIVIMPSKEAKEIRIAETNIVSHYNQFNHRVAKFSSDHENTLLKTAEHVNQLGIIFNASIPARHQTTIERAIQTLLKKMGVIASSLMYVIPDKFMGELMIFCCMLLNMTPNAKTSPHSPQYVVEGKRSTVPRHSWGTPAIFHHVRKDIGTRVDTGIIVGYENSDMNRYRVYVFKSDRVVIRLAPQQVLPDVLPEWMLEPTYKTRPNAVAERRAVENNEPSSSNLNFAVQGERAISSLEPRKLVLDDYSSVKQTPNIQVTRVEEIASDIASITPAISTQDDSISPATSTAILEIHTTEQISPSIITPVVEESAMTATSNTNLMQQRRSSRRQEGDRVNYSSYRYADPTSDRAQARQTMCSLLSSCRPSQLVVKAFNTSVKKAMNSVKRSEAHSAISAELLNMLKTHLSLEPRHFRDIPLEHRAGIMILYMFLKEKFNPAGEFLKMKARLVVGGDRQSSETYSSIASPTVNPVTLMTIINLLVIEDRECATFDVPAAFLVPPMPEDVHFYGVLDDMTSAIAVELDSSLQQFVGSGGRIYFRIRKYQYGLHQASMKFYEYLTEYLVSLGFEQTKLDPCLFIINTSDGRVDALFHVDDIFLTAPNKVLIAHYAAIFKKDLNVEQHFHSPYSFIGMTLTRDRVNKTIKVTMGALTDKLIERYAQDLTPAVTPSTDRLIDVPTSGDLSLALVPKKQSDFVTIVMTLLFIARFTRIDCLFAVTILATRLKQATVSDYNESIRIIRYFQGTRSVGLIYRKTPLAIAEAWADGSHGLLAGRGIGSLIITLGSAMVICRCWLLKFITLSSAESEVLTVTEGITYILWLRALLCLLGHPQDSPTIIYQDNTAAIAMQEEGRGTFRRSKHLLAKISFVDQHIADGSVTLVKKPSKEMIVDMLNKVVNGPQLRSNMLGASMA